MGTLMGHVLPGTFFIAFGLWWMWSIFDKYYRSQYFRSANNVYRSTSSFPCPCTQRLPIEGLVKIIMVCTGITGETATGIKGGHWTEWGNAQHISMFFFFGFSGLMDVLYFYNFNIPAGLDYITGALAFAIEGLLFANHLHGRTHMDVLLHTLLLYIIVGCFTSILAEMWFKSSAVPALARAYFTFIQGTWFYQVGFILYPLPGMSEWNQEDHAQMMIVMVIFSWHFALGLAVLLGIMGLVACRVKHFAVHFQDVCSSIPYQKIDLDHLENGDGSPSTRSSARKNANSKGISADQLHAVMEETSEEEI